MKAFRQVRILALYFAIPALSAITPLIVLPALTSSYGSSGLAAIAIGQSLGSGAAVIAELGWGVFGPQEVARADSASRSELYQSAFATRISALAVVSPIAVTASIMIAADHKVAAAFIALAFSVGAMSPGWFLVGCNRPLLLLATEAVPRMVLSAACALLILMGGPLELYGLSLFAAAIVTWLLTANFTKQQFWPPFDSFRNGRSVIKHHIPITFGRIVSVLYTALPVTIVALVSPSSTATYAAIDRLIRMALSLLGGVPSRLQSWIGSRRDAARVRRSRQSLAMNAVLGLVAGLGFTGLAPVVSQFVFSGVVELGFDLTALGGAVIFAICASRGFGLSLVAEGRANSIALANVGAAIVGVVSVYLLGGLWGARGGLLGLLSAEITGLIIQAFTLFASARWVNMKRKVARGGVLSDGADIE